MEMAFWTALLLGNIHAGHPLPISLLFALIVNILLLYNGLLYPWITSLQIIISCLIALRGLIFANQSGSQDIF